MTLSNLEFKVVSLVLTISMVTPIFLWSHQSINGALGYIVIAFPLLTIASIAKGNRSALLASGSSSKIWDIASSSSVPEILLATTFVIMSVFWLNLFLCLKPNYVITFVSFLIGIFNTFLFLQLVTLQDQSMERLAGQKNKNGQIRAKYAWSVLSFLFTAPVVLAGAILAFRNWRLNLQLSEYTSPNVILTWIFLNALFFGGVLFRPRKFSKALNSKITLCVCLIVAASIGLGSGLETIWRNDWYLFAISSLSVIGLVSGTIRILDSCLKLETADALASHPESGF